MSAAKRTKTAEAAAAASVKGRITRYFNECRSQDIPPTPAGLALALGMSTAGLTAASLPETLRGPIERALLRIERETLERALSGKGGAKGVDFVLQQTAQAGGPADSLQALSDEELDRRLAETAKEIAALLKATP